MELFIILFTGFLSYTNGANDVSKGIATLVGSRTTTLVSGLLLGTIATIAGVFAAARFSSAMIETFTAGISATGMQIHVSLLATVIGATVWVAFATRTGMPVSTTHPSLPSTNPLTPISSREIAAPLRVFTGSLGGCVSSPGTVGVRFLDTAHYVSAGFTCFARALNDAPKIVPFLLLLPSTQISGLQGYVYIGLAMALGGLIASRPVVDTMSTGITRVSHSEGLLANITTSILVAGGAWLGLPMSTTHVSTSAIAGAGKSHGGAISRETVRRIALAWIVTVPLSALIAMAAVFVIRLSLS